MYKFLPHKKMKFVYQLPGAFAASIAWYVFSMLIAVYITEFNGFSMYGSLATLTLVMFWLFFSCYIILIGAEINELIHPSPREDQPGPENGTEASIPKKKKDAAT